MDFHLNGTISMLLKIKKKLLPYIHQFLIDFLFDVNIQFELKMLLSFFAVRRPNS